VTAGFIYVGAGEFWFGDGDEQLRTQFLDTAPLHRRATDGYLIARNEVTFREWIAFLAATPAGERALLSPRAPGGTRGWVQLREDESGWQLVFQPATHRYTARKGEPIVYAGRKTLASQDWLDFPVSGVSAQDAQRYLAWLRATGRVPNARFCTELEWERAARGADDRVYPNGDQLRPEDANFDLTYGRLGSAYGPDVVGSHPATRSPFGIDDLVGSGFVAGCRGRAAGSRRGIFLWRGVLPQHQSRDRAGHAARLDDRISRVRNPSGGSLACGAIDETFAWLRSGWRRWR
jgi:formylglycine-generating enzyme required for sulfatase activity